MRPVVAAPLPGKSLVLLVAFVAVALQGATLETGTEISCDATSGLSGDIEGGSSLHGMALWHAAWSAPATRAGADQDRAFVSILGLAGQGPTARFVGDLLAVSNTEGFESLRLYATWWESNRGPCNLRAGLLLADEEFGLTEAGAELLNSSFGWPVFISASIRNTGPAFYAPAAGVRLRWTLASEQTVQLAIYDGDSFDSLEGDPSVNRHGLHHELSSDQGAFAIAEYSNSSRAPVRAKLGAWTHTGRFPDLYWSELGAPLATGGGGARMHPGNYGAYAIVEHHVTRPAPREGGRTCHLRLGTVPADRNAVAWGFDLGVAWHGLIGSRPNDVLAIGLTQARHSAWYRRAGAEAEPSQPPPDYEQVIEVAYRWEVADYLSIQPDLQYVRHLGGSARRGDAMLLIVRLQTGF